VHKVSDLAGLDFLAATSLVASVPGDKLTGERVDLPWLASGGDGAAVEPPPSPPPPRLRRRGEPPPPVVEALPAGGLPSAPSDGRALFALGSLRRLAPRYLPSVTRAFCVPPNPELAMLRLRATLNLGKLQKQRDIAGHLTALAGGHRYRALREEAERLGGVAAKLEGALVAAEAQAGQYTPLQAQKDVRLAGTVVRLQELRVAGAHGRRRRAAAEVTRAQGAAERLRRVAEEGAAGHERAIVALADAGALELVVSGERRARDAEAQAAAAERDARLAMLLSSRAEEEARLAADELRILELRAAAAQWVVDFIASRFGGQELGEVITSVLKRGYGFALQQATSAAQRALDQVAFDRQAAPPPLVQSDYWQAPGDPRFGSTARLAADLYELEAYRAETEQRKLALEQTFSVASLAPDALVRLRETGLLLFPTPLERYDAEQPGLVLRRVRRVRVTIRTRAPLGAPLHAILTASRLSRVVAGGATVTIERGPGAVALGAPAGASGLLELVAEGESPFGGMGVDATWELHLPLAANLFDFDALVDVLFTVEHTALVSAGHRQQVLGTLPRQLSAVRPFSLRAHFPAASVGEPGGPSTVRLATRREDFPPHLGELRIEHVGVALVGSGELDGVELSFVPAGGVAGLGGKARTVGGLASSRLGSGAGWAALAGRPPIGQWTLGLPEAARAALGDGRIGDILLLVGYQGRLPEWPR
jgi:hypothetical protein